MSKCGSPGVRQCLWGVKVGVKCEMGVKKSENKFGEVGVLRWGYLRGLEGFLGVKTVFFGVNCDFWGFCPAGAGFSWCGN